MTRAGGGLVLSGIALLALAVGPPVAPGAPARTPAAGAPARPGTGDHAGTDERNGPVTVDADRMERFGKEHIIVFTGHVVARHYRATQYAERTEVYLDDRGEQVLRTVSTGNVRIVTRDCRTGTARRAEYVDLDQQLILSGDARFWQGDDVVTGETITIFLAEDRAVVEGATPSRVRAVFNPQGEGQKAGSAPKPTALCTE